MRNRQFIMRVIIVFCSISLLIGCRYNKCLNCKIKKDEVSQEKGIDNFQNLTKEKKFKELQKNLKVTPLFTKWYHILDNSKIEKLYLVDDLLIAESDKNTLFAFDRKTGIPKWVYKVGTVVDYKPEIYKDKVYILGMAKLHILDKKTGSVLVKKELDFVPSSPMAISGNKIYMGAWDSFLYALNTKNGDREWRYRIDGLIHGKPLIVDGTLYFSGTDQKVYAINAHNGVTDYSWGKNGYYKTRGPNTTNLVGDSQPPIVYTGSRDYNLYSFNRITGELRWKFESGGEIIHPVHKIGNSIYTVSSRTLKKDTVLYVVDSETGNKKWSIDKGVWFLFPGKYHDWILKNDKTVVAIKNINGKIKSKHNLGIFDLFITNTKDNIGYLATSDGFLFAVEER